MITVYHLPLRAASDVPWILRSRMCTSYDCAPNDSTENVLPFMDLGIVHARSAHSTNADTKLKIETPKLVLAGACLAVAVHEYCSSLGSSAQLWEKHVRRTQKKNAQASDTSERSGWVCACNCLWPNAEKLRWQNTAHMSTETVVGVERALFTLQVYSLEKSILIEWVCVCVRQTS